MNGGASSGGPIVKVIVTQSKIIAPKRIIIDNLLFLNSFIMFHFPPMGVIISEKLMYVLFKKL